MNWTGGRLTNTATKFGISRNKSLDCVLDPILGHSERASVIARCKRQQRQHFQKMARLKKSYKPELLSSREGGGSSSPLVRHIGRKIVGSVEFSINQRINHEKNDATPKEGLLCLANQELGRKIPDSGEERVPMQLDGASVNTSLLETSPTPTQSLADRKRALLERDDWSSIFLADPKRRRVESQEIPHASKKVRAVEVDTNVSKSMGPTASRTGDLHELKSRRLSSGTYAPSTPFKLDYAARGFASTSSSPYSALASSPIKYRGLGGGNAVQLRTVVEDEDKEREYAMQFGEGGRAIDLGKDSSDRTRIYDDGKYGVYEEVSSGIISGSVKLENSLGEFGGLKSSFSHSNVPVRDTSFESLHTSGSFDHFDDHDGWKVAMTSTSVADDTKSTSIANHDGEGKISEDVAREWRELIGKHIQVDSSICPGLDVNITSGVRVESSETDAANDGKLFLSKAHHKEAADRESWQMFAEITDPVLSSSESC
ncbi:hypothetical protein V1517DRAFT_312422 [Lipomyces orientalis]|uniref:Uncharacterized protein n=1 Tax=Lipomyces orientalis TaxID=1233043 RepID=A0ACC3TYG6_9ASCO